ncbi:MULTISPECIES: hypothetical protein [Muribaculaceae]|uniref:hypothetical protein n=1 Tax=Muribaculaceae TaxID=2005473 RepID=UPI0025B75D47|nr:MULTISPECIES: hypothetical protein [Muribaculaceae]
MKTALTIQAQAKPRKLSVKKLLIRLIIFLTSSKFFIFVGQLACIVCWWGNMIGDHYMVGRGGIAFLAGFTPWAWRETRRSMRHPERNK